MKKAEIFMASFWVALSTALLWEIHLNPGTRQPIGWEQGVGPQAGWFPYYLALIMLICSLIVLVPKLIQAAKEGLADKPFVTFEGLKAILWAVGPMLLYVITLPWLGFYLGSTIYLIYYIRSVGKHSWKLALSTGIIFSVAIFVTFEMALKLSLAKGFIEPILYMLL
jgi:hypothetical protein